MSGTESFDDFKASLTSGPGLAGPIKRIVSRDKNGLTAYDRIRKRMMVDRELEADLIEIVPGIREMLYANERVQAELEEPIEWTGKDIAIALNTEWPIKPHAGRSLRALAQDEPDYLRSIPLTSITSPKLRRALRCILETQLTPETEQ